MDWLKKRLGENSTWLGLAGIALGVGQMAKISEAPAIAEGIAAAGPAIVTGNWVNVLGIVLATVAAVRKDK